jgi:CBS domain-containing protein
LPRPEAGILGKVSRRREEILVLIAEVLRTKGSFVATIPPERTVAEVLRALAERRVGALVVSGDGEHIDGIVSERDVVRHLDRVGARLLDEPARTIMTADVRTCSPSEKVDDLTLVMTEHRIRHVPVVDDGVLVGIVSIGDIVKSRIGDLEGERNELVAYIRGG